MSYAKTLGSYLEIISNKFERGDIDYERYCFLIEKLTQWEYVWREELIAE